ncbi:hypothetical protein BJX61DRAFT_43743 [Aspergillus egyptiacus]|nr:hypothetical protein BJX61DRAFT_43743 [Aspergillus egyptiacus]
MTKPKRARVQQQHAHPANPSHGAGRKHRKMSSFAKLSTKNNFNKNINNGAGSSGKANDNAVAKKTKNKEHRQETHLRPIVPFRRSDRILCVGEGDFSFARSLATYHRCRNLIATCYDSKEALYAKYPQAETNIEEILASRNPKGAQPHPKVLFSVDAKKLGSASGGGKEVRTGFPKRERKRPAWEKGKDDGAKNKKGRTGGPWDMVCFNFPHVGGLSTDVNRQVRANQELLVAFFKACVPLLAGKPDEEEDLENEEDGWQHGTGESDEDEDESRNESEDEIEKDTVKAKDERRTEPGQILVTLFEGEPYTLWNIRDLARHAGLRVVTSFKFPWACYRGYSHARTLGEIQAKNGERGGWRGEDRDARMYVFEVKTDDPTWSGGTAGKRKKISAETDDSDSG